MVITVCSLQQQFQHTDEQRQAMVVTVCYLQQRFQHTDKQKQVLVVTVCDLHYSSDFSTQMSSVWRKDTSKARLWSWSMVSCACVPST